MPIASGAAGRVDSGVDTGKIWTPDRLKVTKLVGRNCDSYLQRYQEQRKKNKVTVSQDKQDNTDQIDQENDGTKMETSKEHSSSEDPISVKPRSGGKPKKSALCILF